MATIITGTHGVNSGTIPTDSTWYEAEVTDIAAETPCTKTFTFRLPHPVVHAAGQHYELRLTAADGYQAARLHSAASAAMGDDTLQLTIAHMPDGEVSPYLHQSLQPGDMLEIRGPLGRSFVWDATHRGPVLLVAGGIGVVPLRCMLQAHLLAHSDIPMQLLWSCRSEREIIYRDELLTNPAVNITLTRSWPKDWNGKTGHITSGMVQEVLRRLPGKPMCYVCGMTRFVEAANALLLDLGVPPMYIKAERFGS